MDDLLDLDWAKQPARNNVQQPPRNGASPAWSTGSGGASSSYNFDALTRSMPTSSTARPSSASSVQQTQSKQTTTTSSGDAFSSLLGFGGSGNTAKGGSGAGATLSMAERLRQQSQNSPLSSSPTGAQNSMGRASPSAWEGLDNLGGSSAASRPQPPTARVQQPAKQQPKNDDALWDFSTPAVAAKPTARPAQASATAKAAPKPAAKPSNDPFDFSEFEDPGAFQSSALGGGDDGAKRELAPAAKSKGKPQSNSLFDTSDTIDDGDDDDDLLGELGKRPARPLASTYEHAEERRAPPKPAASTRSGAASPPPHIIGQVVEMGFSPQQAREALGRTSTGQDVQAALEMLLQSSGQNSANGRGTPQSTAGRRGGAAEESDRRMAMRLQREEQERHAGGGPRWQSANSAAGKFDDEDSRAGTPDWQKQADQLYAQASELGANVFSKANSLWATAKSQAQRALEEHNLGTGSAAGSSAPSSGRASPATGSDRARSRRWAVPSRDGGGGGGGGGGATRQGKPKWMVDAEAAEAEEAAGPTKTEGQGFKDDDDDDDDVQEAPPFFAPAARKTEARTAPTKAGATTSKTSASLWGGDEEVQDRPQQRRPSPIALQAAAPSATAARGQAGQPRRNGQATAAAPAARPVTLRTRRLAADDASAVQTAVQHKERGNALYKRGAYGEAESAYTTALSALDGNPQSVRRVVLFNNRANARLKNGDAKGTLDDTMAVLRLIVVDDQGKGSPFLLFRPSQEAALPQPEYADINLREGYAKALLRRAQAEEMLERWDPALSVWSLLVKYEKEEGSGGNGVANMRAAEQGKGRCNKMLKGGGGDGEEAAPIPRVRAAASRAVAKAEAQAKERIRGENAAAAAEETAKDGLRDSVDARVVAWRTGKENNVRALLASLHDVVWPALAWKRVGMHELVMDAQVKKAYMRAIGKLHPDKLTPRNNSLEERMLGGAVFSVLNDAWSAAQS